MSPIVKVKKGKRQTYARGEEKNVRKKKKTTNVSKKSPKEGKDKVMSQISLDGSKTGRYVSRRAFLLFMVLQIVYSLYGTIFLYY